MQKKICIYMIVVLLLLRAYKLLDVLKMNE